MQNCENADIPKRIRRIPAQKK